MGSRTLCGGQIDISTRYLNFSVLMGGEDGAGDRLETREWQPISVLLQLCTIRRFSSSSHISPLNRRVLCSAHVTACSAASRLHFVPNPAETDSQFWEYRICNKSIQSCFPLSRSGDHSRHRGESWDMSHAWSRQKSLFFSVYTPHISRVHCGMSITVTLNQIRYAACPGPFWVDACAEKEGSQDRHSYLPKQARKNASLCS